MLDKILSHRMTRFIFALSSETEYINMLTHIIHFCLFLFITSNIIFADVFPSK